MSDEVDDKGTMVNALREEPGSYTRALEDGGEVIYEIQPSEEGGFTAGWEHYAAGSNLEERPSSSHEEKFSSHADALKYLEENFDAPLNPE